MGTENIWPAKLSARVRPEIVNPLTIVRIAVGTVTEGVRVQFVDHVGPGWWPQPGAALQGCSVQGAVINDRVVRIYRDRQGKPVPYSFEQTQFRYRIAGDVEQTAQFAVLRQQEPNDVRESACSHAAEDRAAVRAQFSVVLREQP